MKLPCRLHGPSRWLVLDLPFGRPPKYISSISHALWFFCTWECMYVAYATFLVHSDFCKWKCMSVAYATYLDLPFGWPPKYIFYFSYTLDFLHMGMYVWSICNISRALWFLQMKMYVCSICNIFRPSLFGWPSKYIFNFSYNLIFADGNVCM